MRLGLNLGYWSTGRDHDQLALAQAAERLGFSVVWAAEAYGSDAATVLGYLAGRTSRIDLGSAVFQIPARTPAMTAMTAVTLDWLSGGRFRLGLGVSGPQVSEGWHGVRFDAPLSRTKEYVEIVRLALRREPVEYAGNHYTLPLPDGAGKALRLTVHPVRGDMPIYLAAIGPRNLELAGEVGDGVLCLFFSPAYANEQLARLAAGRARAGATLADFDVVANVPLSVGADVSECADRVRGYAALYVGGMGSRKKNFYNDLARRMGFEAAAEQIQACYLAGDRPAAMAAVPLEFLDATTLLGPRERIAERLLAFSSAGVTTLCVSPYAESAEAQLAALQTLVEAAELAAAG
jgi:F420-dependent oxidoreductase-like protein